MVTPVLDEGNLDLPWVDLGHGAHFLGHLNTLLLRHQSWHQLGHLPAHPLRLHVTLLHWLADDHSLHLVRTNWSSLVK